MCKIKRNNIRSNRWNGQAATILNYNIEENMFMNHKYKM